MSFSKEIALDLTRQPDLACRADPELVAHGDANSFVAGRTADVVNSISSKQMLLLHGSGTDLSYLSLSFPSLFPVASEPCDATEPGNDNGVFS